MLGRTPCFAAFPEEAALCRSDNYIMTGSTDPGCPQVLPGILIAKMAIWGFVLAASGHFAKLQFGPQDAHELDARVIAELTAVREDQAFLRNLFHASDLPLPRALLS